MDSITQAVLGAAIGESLLGKKLGNKGALVGAGLATLPDLDVILYLFYNKYDMLSIHRGYSHSIAFSLIGALLAAYLLSHLKLFAEIKFKTTTLFTWLCLFTHMLLDTFTSYGTQLLLPFSGSRLGFDSINVVDPVYTVPLIIGLVLSLGIYKSKPTRSKYNNYGLVISSLYLLFTLLNKEAVASSISDRMQQENIEYQALLTMPVGIANISWYGVAKGKDSIYMVQHDILSKTDYSIETFPINEAYLDQIDKKVAEKMRWFSKGFYTVTKDKSKIRIYNLQVDMRGIIKEGSKKAPTAGYFEITTKNGETVFSSGSIARRE